MAWLRSAMTRATEPRGRSSIGDVVRSRTGYISLPGIDVLKDATKLRDRVKARNMNSYKEEIRRLEEVSVSCKGDERVELLKSWLVSLKQIERQSAVSAKNDKNYTEESHTPNYKNHSPGNPDVTLYYDPDLSLSPVNFRDVLLQSQALEGITMSMIVGAPNEEETLLLHELFGLCLTGGEEVHDVIVKRILDLSKAFSVYNEEVLVKRKELLQFAHDAISGLKLNIDILRIDSEISEIHHQLAIIESDPKFSDVTSDVTLEVIQDSVTPIRLCCRLESLLLKKKLLSSGDTPHDHACKVDKLKVLSESLLSSAGNTEKRVSDHRQQKEEALYFRVAKTSEVSQIEKELGDEIKELEKQRDKLETELIKVKSLLAIANNRLQDATDEREQFDDANNQLLVHFKSKEDELSKEIISCKAEAGTCTAFVEFLEATWDFQSSFMEQKEKKINDELVIHEEYFVKATRTLLSAYKDALGPAISLLREHMKNLKSYDEKAIDPDEEFLQDIEQRISLQHAYMAAETKVIAIFDAAESVRVQFYKSIDNVSRKGVEPVNELCEAIENIKSDFESSPRPYLGDDKLSNVEQIASKETLQKGVSPSSKRALTVDIKSILTQKLVPRSPKKKPYIPLGGSPENSPSKPIHQQQDVHVAKDDKSPKTPPSIEKENIKELIVESQEHSFMNEPEKLLEPFKELGNFASELFRNNDDQSVSQSSSTESDKSSDTDE